MTDDATRLESEPENKPQPEPEPAPKRVGKIDAFQRRHAVLGFPIAVVYKFFDDQGNFMAATLTYYAFVAIFPLLLLASSIFGFVLQGDPALKKRALDSALAQFPIIGDQLGRPEGLTGSTTTVIVGALAALYGALGLGQSIQNVLNTVWAVPRNSRPNPFLMRVRSLLLLTTAGLAVLALSIFSAIFSNTEMLGARLEGLLRWLLLLGTVVLVAGGLSLLFALASAQVHRWHRAIPGAVVVAVLWQALQYGGTVYATRVLGETTSMNQTFGLVLGLVGLIFLAAIIGVLGLEVNVVLARRLWPRALLTPFTDGIVLTEADRATYTLYAQTQRHKGFEKVTVTFEGQQQSPDQAKDQVHTESGEPLDSNG